MVFNFIRIICLFACFVKRSGLLVLKYFYFFTPNTRCALGVAVGVAIRNEELISWKPQELNKTKFIKIELLKLSGVGVRLQ